MGAVTNFDRDAIDIAMPHSESFFHHRRRRRVRAWAIALACVVAVALSAGAVGIGAAAEARAFRADIGAVETAIVARDFALAGERLADAYARLTRADALVRMAAIARPIPYINDQAYAARVIVEDTRELLNVAAAFVRIGIDVQEQVRAVGGLPSLKQAGAFSALSADERRALIAALARAVPSLETLHARLNTHSQELAALGEQPLAPGLRFVYNDLVAQTERADALLTLAIPWLSILPDIGGFDGAPATYMLLLQNTGELRPTGGFWGTYGFLTMENGEIVDVQTDDIYAVDVLAIGRRTTAPPEPLRKYLGVDTWFLRDINWSPDVPTSVRDGLAAYREEIAYAPSPTQTGTLSPRLVDGVILVTPRVAEKLLATLGTARVGDLVFSPDTFFDTLEYEVEVGHSDRGIAREDRKDVVGTLIRDLLARARDGGGDTVQALLDVALASLNEQDLVMYHTDAAIQRVLETQGWAGDMRVPPPGRDHFMVVDANLAALKTDARVDRAYAYSVSRRLDGRYEAALRIDYDHFGDFDYRTTRYRTYTRVYVPRGSELVRVDGSLDDDRLKNPRGAAGRVDAYEEFGATVFGAFTSVEPGATGSLTFRYVLPDAVGRSLESGAYTLSVQRQIGLGDVPLSLDVGFGREVSSAEPGEAQEYWHDNTYTYSTRLVPHQEFRVWLE